MTLPLIFDGKQLKQFGNLISQGFCQRGVTREPMWVDHHSDEGGIAFGEEVGAQLMEELCAEGVLTRREDGRYALTDWERYRFDFNI